MQSSISEYINVHLNEQRACARLFTLAHIEQVLRWKSNFGSPAIEAAIAVILLLQLLRVFDCSWFKVRLRVQYAVCIGQGWPAFIFANNCQLMLQSIIAIFR